KDNIKYKEIAEGNLELIDLVLGLYKKKSKYSSIQKDVLEKYNIKLGYDDIKEIIDNRQKLNNRIEINKNDEKEKLQKQRIREYEYSCIPDTIEALERRGISVDYETIKQAYDAIQDSSFSSKWSVRDLGEWYYLSLLKEGMTFSEYTDAIHRMMDSRFDM
ncbi:MAG: hypothetical protein IKU53_03930, partial [Firmicutes bacterium]|nr:hypothetical protein [Bacillota bacterium]